ncbi:phosphoenolpyruvate--protein phosphotransferase [Photobacterium gaetbulicola]|uniref:Putative phosphoenolpyruvate-protein phosphotransferase n=1 Tax=Photobacterium gaetbulicola Gung47 TaxID=658445 RepID=A0A0C5WHF8_9GAMM|nr:phosphoenolpyruvate--protein phosphotransferase [Photobacterium gaetbulicola]AJR05617.1 putative phosphoenolpyruvate-protein phosphotransferase [Photobacterium gaetbulicola Gung47]PSU14598.1 phosphoenolpyruvate--protein phosphotransferase [Photobacterium gaetbulicola]
MTKSIEFTNPLVNGIHARPAAEIENRTTPFCCQISLLNISKGTKADAKSVLSLVGADVAVGDECQLVFDGTDEQPAFEAMKAFIEGEFADCDEPLECSEADVCQPLPVSLLKAEPVYVRGSIVSRGIGKGCPVVCSQVDLHKLAESVAFEENGPAEETIKKARHILCQQIEQAIAQAKAQGSREELSILKAHLQIASDSLFSQSLAKHSLQGNPILAIAKASDELKAPMLKSQSSYMRERALDIDDLCARLASLVVGKPLQQPVTLVKESILVADNLTPSEFLALDKRWLKGIVLAQAGQTSHTVILARSFGIPVLTAVEAVDAFVQDAESLVLDGLCGCLIRDPNEKVEQFYLLEHHKHLAKTSLLTAYASSKGQSKDGRALSLYANIAVGLEASSAFERGAEGIGLFRTEMLFMDRDDAPSEEQQYDVYREVIEAAAGKTVIIRTLDIGGDKPLPYLEMPEEENPFLGYRAVRMYPQYQHMIESQIRALLRASRHGEVNIMIPMVACMEEVEWIHQLCQQCEAQLTAEGRVTGCWRLGIMVEVPSARYLLEKAAGLIDFISIGSNDLTQYFMACDRGNRQVGALYDSFHPGFIAFLAEIAKTAKTAGIELGICGEMASDKRALPLLLAMGFDEISLSSPNIIQRRADLAQLEYASCCKLLDEVCGLASLDEVKAKIDQFWQQQDHPEILSEQLVVQCHAIDKAGVIKQLTDNLEVHGRAENAVAVEQAIWDREAIFATSLGFGVAVPHCKSAAVNHNSISIAHLEQPIVWNEADGETVSTVIMLTISSHDDEGTHMSIFSKLARKLMHREFRDALMNNALGREQTVSLLKGVLYEQVA